MTTYAVTGASGKLGHLIVEALLARGVDARDIVALARAETKARDLADRGVTVRHADYDLPATLTSALAGVDRLVLVSGSEPGRRETQHQAVIAAAEHTGVSRIVYTSLLNAAITSNPLAPEHVATEKMLTASPIQATIMRNSWYIENYTDQIPAYLAQGAITTATDNARIGVATRRDYAEAAAVAAIRDDAGQIYELAGVTMTMSQFAQALSTATQTAVRHRAVGFADLVGTLMHGAGMDADTAGFWASIDMAIANGDLESDSTDLADLIGREPTGLDAAIAAAI